MTIAWSIVWAWLRTSGVGLIALVPRQVWYGLAIGVAVLYFAHWNQEKGRALCQAEVRQASQAESDRVKQADQVAIQAAEQRAQRAEQAAADRQKEMEDAIAAARTSANANRVCLPADVVDRLRHIK
jgi:hypothetical protein